MRKKKPIKVVRYSANLTPCVIYKRKTRLDCENVDIYSQVCIFLSQILLLKPSTQHRTWSEKGRTMKSSRLSRQQIQINSDKASFKLKLLSCFGYGRSVKSGISSSDDGSLFV